MENVVREKSRVSNMLCRAVASVKEANWDTTPVQRGEGPLLPYLSPATLRYAKMSDFLEVEYEH